MNLNRVAFQVSGITLNVPALFVYADGQSCRMLWTRCCRHLCHSSYTIFNILFHVEGKNFTYDSYKVLSLEAPSINKQFLT